MLVRTAIGVVVLLGLGALAALVDRLRGSGRPILRTVAARVHWGIGVIAVGCLALFAVLLVEAVRS
jgi:hypothetical protein